MTKRSMWAKPIEVQDYVTLTVESVGGKDTVFQTKDAVELEGSRLRVKVDMTFAGLPTKNDAIYLPDEMKKGLSTWMKDYLKPVQVHHDNFKDAVGRILDVRYVDTTVGASEEVLDAYKPFSTDTTLLDKLKSASKFYELSKTEGYRGVGHIEGLWDISDPEAVRKIMDGRYKTVSTAFNPEGAYCSICALEDKVTDWKVQTCSHEPGKNYEVEGKSFRCLAIPYNFDYYEASFVNTPAATLAQVKEVGDNLSFSDATREKGYTTISDAVIVIGEKAYRFQDSVAVDVPKTISQSVSVQPSSVIDSDETKTNSGAEHSPDSIGEDIMDPEMMKYLDEKFAALVDLMSVKFDALKEMMSAPKEEEAPSEDSTEDAVETSDAEALRKEIAELKDSVSKLRIVDTSMLTNSMGYSGPAKKFENLIDAVRYIEREDKLNYKQALVKAAKLYPALAKSNDK